MFLGAKLGGKPDIDVWSQRCKNSFGAGKDPPLRQCKWFFCPFCFASSGLITITFFQPKADVTPNPVTPFLAKLMDHIVAKWGRNNEKYCIGNLKDRSQLMHVDNAMLTIWARALMHNQNEDVTLDHPPSTKHFFGSISTSPRSKNSYPKGKALRGPRTRNLQTVPVLCPTYRLTILCPSYPLRSTQGTQVPFPKVPRDRWSRTQNPPLLHPALTSRSCGVNHNWWIPVTTLRFLLIPRKIGNPTDPRLANMPAARLAISLET
jgi:hypothetical protein